MLFQQFAFAGHIAAVAFGQHIFARGFDGFAGDDFAVDRGLNGDFEHLTRDELADARGQFAPAGGGVGAGDHHRQRVHRFAVHQDVQPDDVCGAMLFKFVIQRGESAGGGFEFVEKSGDEFGEGDVVSQQRLFSGDFHFGLHGAASGGQGHHGAHPFGGDDDGGGGHRFADFADAGGLRQAGGVVDDDCFFVGCFHFAGHAGRGDDNFGVVLAFKALLHDFHMQESEESAAQAEAEGGGFFGFKTEGGVVQAEFFGGGSQALEVVWRGGKQRGEDMRLGFLKAGQGGFCRGVGAGEGVADAGGGQVFQSGGDIADFPGGEGLAGFGLGGEDADGVAFAAGAGGHKAGAVAAVELSVDHADEDDDAEVFVEPRVDNQRAQGGFGVAGRGGDFFDDGVEDLVDALSAFGGDGDGLGGVDAGHVLDFFLDAEGVGGGQVDFRQGGDDFQPEVGGGVAGGDGLGLDALRGVDQQERAFAGGERAGHFVGEVDMSGGVEQVEAELISVGGFVAQQGGLGFDGDSALAFEVHGVQHLGAVVAGVDGAASAHERVGEGGLSVVHMRDDGEVAKRVHTRGRGIIAGFAKGGEFGDGGGVLAQFGGGLAVLIRR